MRASLGRLKVVRKAPSLDVVSNLQLSVVFILPKLTNKHTIAIFFAGSLSLINFSLKILLVLLLRAIVSIYKSAKHCFGISGS